MKEVKRDERRQDVVRFVLEKYLAENLVEIIMDDIKAASAAEGGESDDVDK